MTYKDVSLICADCGQEFAWTADEQQFYHTKGLPQPEHCLICRGKYQALQKDLGRYKRKNRL